MIIMSSVEATEGHFDASIMRQWMTYERAITEACHRYPTPARAAWAGVVQRTGIQSAIAWPVAEIERFLAETLFNKQGHIVANLMP